MNDLGKIIDDVTNPFKANFSQESFEKVFFVIKNDYEASQKALRLLAHRIQSPSENEALNALAVVDFCANKMDSHFLEEMGKFKFLNELVKLMSPKFMGGQTTQKVKDRCANLLFQWKTKFTAYEKFGKTYDMLVSQGDIDPKIIKDPFITDKGGVSSNRISSADIIENSSKGQEIKLLLKSKNKEDLEKANRLIKELIDKDSEKIERENNRKIQLDNVQSNTKILRELLSDEEYNEEKISIIGDLLKALTKELDALNGLIYGIDDEELSIKKPNNDPKGLSVSADGFPMNKESQFLIDAIPVCDKANDLIKVTKDYLASPKKIIEVSSDHIIDSTNDVETTPSIFNEIADDLSSINFASTNESHILTPVPISLDDEALINFEATSMKSAEPEPSTKKYDVFREIDSAQSDINSLLGPSLGETTLNLEQLQPMVAHVNDNGLLTSRAQRSITHPPSKADRDNALFRELDSLGRDLFNTLDLKSTKETLQDPFNIPLIPQNSPQKIDIDSIEINFTDIKSKENIRPVEAYSSHDDLIKITLSNFSFKNPNSIYKNIDIWLAFMTNKSSDPINKIDLDLRIMGHKVKRMPNSVDSLLGYVEFLPLPTLTQLFIVQSDTNQPSIVTGEFHISYIQTLGHVSLKKNISLTLFQ